MKKHTLRLGTGRTETKLVVWAAVALLIIAGCARPRQQAVLPVVPAAPNPWPESITYQEEQLPAEVDIDDLVKLVEGNTAFALDLYQEMRKDEEADNLFFSPFSISQALAMTFAGARGQTETQMAQTLHFTLGQASLHAAINALSQVLSESAKAVATRTIEADAGEQPSALELNIANAIWAQKDYPFLQTFLDLLDEHYGAGMHVVNFQGQPESSRLVINSWVAEQTAQRIQDLLPPGSINSLTRMVLTNAIYFKASWADKFDALATQDGPFSRLDGSQVLIPLMFKVGPLGYGRGKDYQAVELPYYGHSASMVVILPDEGRFEGFEEDLKVDELEQILASLSRQEVALTLPKFTMEPESISLRRILAAMGMPAAFGSGANFSGMDGTRDLFIDDVIHKAFVAVDEQGTEAAAATAVVMKMVSARDEPEAIEVRVDRPFIFLIRDLKTGTVLFLGRVLDPAA